jgi:tRNA dimethylallyltransferase
MANSGENRPIVPVLTGPTGSGKSEVVSRLLELHPGIHIISADSRQVYKHLNIGTDKPVKEHLAQYHYHLIDFVEPGERYTVFNFVADAEKLIGDIVRRGELPLICGGTGLYIRSLVEGIMEITEDDFAIRRRLENEAAEHGPESLFKQLRDIDPKEAVKIHPNNLRRVIRALEIYYLTGKPKSAVMARRNNRELPFDFEIKCLMPPRDVLYQRINERVDRMIQSGLLREVEMLCGMGLEEKVREINVIGYNELFAYLDDKIALDSAINVIKQNSRRFAKRQITWFKSMKGMAFGETAGEILGHLKGYWVDGK